MWGRKRGEDEGYIHGKKVKLKKKGINEVENKTKKGVI